MAELTPQEVGERLPEELANLKIQLMRRIVLTVERNVRKRTRVKTGHLRRSWVSAVERSGERGRIGTTVTYAKTQKNKPLPEGLEDSRAAITRLLEEAGEDLFQAVIQ